MTAPAADAMTSPTRCTASTIAVLLVVAGAQPFAVAEQQEQDVVGADAVQHDQQDRLQVLPDVPVQRLWPIAMMPVVTATTRRSRRSAGARRSGCGR